MERLARQCSNPPVEAALEQTAPRMPPLHPRPGRTRRSGRAGWSLALILAAAVAIGLVVWLKAPAQPPKGPEGPGAQQLPALESQRLRELAAAYFARDSRKDALESLRPLIELEPPDPRDLISAAIVELRSANVDAARELLDRASKAGDRSAELIYNQARVAYFSYDLARAERQLREVRRIAPDDVPTKLFLGSVLEAIAADSEGSTAEAEALYREVIAGGVDAGASWYRVALFRLGMILHRQGRESEATSLLDEHQRLKERIPDVTPSQLEEGTLGRVQPPPPAGNQPKGPGSLPRFEDAIRVLPQFAGQLGLQLADLDEDCRLDLVTWGPKGLVLALQRDGFQWETRTLVESEVDLALALDLGNDGDLDLVYALGSEIGLQSAYREEPTSPDTEKGPIAWRPLEISLPAVPSAPAAILPLDFDAEGDLDLLLVGGFGARLWRNDGVAPSAAAGTFTDVTAEASLPTDRAFTWALIEDFDTDQDVDLLLGSSAGNYLASNERGGRFSDASNLSAALGGLPSAPLIADLDGDARSDAWHADKVFRGLASGRFGPGKPPTDAPTDLPAAGPWQVADLDLDGSLDVYWVADGGVRGRQSVGLPATRPFQTEALGSSPGREIRFADLDGDLAQDLVWLGDEALEIRRGEQSGSAVRLDYRGKKDNRRAIGAVVEVRAGPIYRRIYWRGMCELVGLGDSAQVDYVRVLWPNGTVLHDLRHGLGDRSCDLGVADSFQPEGPVGSCPFLYTWNGERFEFVTDVLGGTPLGLPMAPGMLVPPDHDEFVLIRGEQRAPRDQDGTRFLELQLTEELREVTYLDRTRLEVVDHPTGTEVYPNELFCFPPFPEPKIHTIESPLAPRKAIGSDGGDWTAALAAVDAEYAAPFTLPPSQMLGLASPHFLELEFDPAALASAPELRLVMTGWFYWTDASVNMAAAFDPRFEFVPPILQLPDGQGGWKDAGPPVGFPAGKTKTMVVDVTELLVRGDPRMRIFTTLRLCWDSIRLAIDDDSTPLALHSLEPSSAELWRRGFSAPLDDGKPYQPLRFVWEHLAELPRWNPHPGQYTRYGECLPLVQAIDDMFVILASGDALTVRFDASELPPVREGWRRDYLLFLDGWAKDRDPNTIQALYVEPLPFHGMSGYPYRPDERFPDDEAHRRWRREWNTRDAQPWLPFQAPAGAPPLAFPDPR